MKRMTAILLALFLVSAIVFTGCAAKSENSMAYDRAEAEIYTEAPQYMYGYTGDNAIPKEEMTSTATGEVLTANRKLIKTVRLTVETEDYAELVRAIEQKVSALGGYIENMESNTPTSGKHRYANMTIRIPAASLHEFTTQVEGSANVIWRNQEQKDITTTYVDNQARRDALEVEQARLLELLEQAQNLTEILEIESRLTDVRYQLESIESMLRTYDNQVDYATVHLEVEEVEVLTPVEEPAFWEKIGSGFVKSVNGVWNVLKSIFSGVIIALPYIVLILLPPAIVLMIIFGVKKRKNRD